MPRQNRRIPAESGASAPSEHRDPEVDTKLVRLVQLKRAQDLAQKLVTLPISPIVFRLVTSSDAEAIRLLREIRRHMPRVPARKVGRPKGATAKLEAWGAILFVLVDMLGVPPARALRFVGSDASSESSDFARLRRRLRAWRQFFVRLSSEERCAWHSDLTRMVFPLLGLRPPERTRP